MKIQYVPQKDKNGCAIACIAMVTGIPYDKVAAQFHADFEKDGIHPEVTRCFVQDQGFSSVEAMAHGYQNLNESNKRMARAFADVHILSVQPKADSKMNHAVVMDKRGRILDPDNPKRKDLSEYYYIVRVCGFWKD